MELHFYPSHHQLFVLENNNPIKRYEAWGGPASLGADPYMQEEPTWPGIYIIDRTEAYRTPTWPFSSIKWGTVLQDRPAQNDVWYQLPSGKWGSVHKDVGITRKEILDLYFQLYRHRRVPPKWVFNDFGPLAIRWFKDLNNNRRLDGTERLSGQMFHTTPLNEAQHQTGQQVTLQPSHGCVHLKPADRTALSVMGAFKPGTTFIVHSYHAKIPH